MSLAVKPATATDSRAVTAGFDWLLIITGGLPIVLPAVLLLGEQRLSGTDPIHWYVWMNAVFSAPHVYSTYVRLSRKIRERRVSMWIGWPTYLAWVGLIMGAYWLDQRMAIGAFVGLITAINVWQTFHYLRQSYGIGRFFEREYGQYSSESSGRSLMFWAYHLSMPVLIFGRWDTLHVMWSGVTYSHIVPVDFPQLLIHLLWALAVVGLAMGVAAEWKNFRAGGGKYHPIGIVNLAIYFGIHWLGFMSLDYFYRGFIAVTIFHGIQYLALVWKLEKRHYGSDPESYYNKIPLVGGFLIFWALLLMMGTGYEQGLVTRVIGPLATPDTAAFVGALILALLTGVSAHHYTIDMFIWRKKAGV